MSQIKGTSFDVSHNVRRGGTILKVGGGALINLLIERSGKLRGFQGPAQGFQGPAQGPRTFLIFQMRAPQPPVPPPMLNVVRNLSSTIILGSQFLDKCHANIDCGSHRLRLQKISQVRVIERQEIPPKSQSVVTDVVQQFLLKIS